VNQLLLAGEPLDAGEINVTAICQLLNPISLDLLVQDRLDCFELFVDITSPGSILDFLVDVAAQVEIAAVALLIDCPVAAHFQLLARFSQFPVCGGVYTSETVGQFARIWLKLIGRPVDEAE